MFNSIHFKKKADRSIMPLFFYVCFHLSHGDIAENFPTYSFDSIRVCSTDQGNQFRNDSPIIFHPFIILINDTRLINRLMCISSAGLYRWTQATNGSSGHGQRGETMQMLIIKINIKACNYKKKEAFAKEKPHLLLLASIKLCCILVKMIRHLIEFSTNAL